MCYHTFNSHLVILYVMLGVVVPCAVFAQSDERAKVVAVPDMAVNNPGHHIIINGLFDYTVVRDKVISPLLYHQITGGIMIGYEYRSILHEHRVLLQMAAGRLTRPGLNEVPGGGTYSNYFLLGVHYLLEYSFAITVVRTRQWQLGVGAMLATTAELRTYTHIWSPVIGFSSSVDIGPSVVGVWQPAPKHSVRARIAVPLLSVINRPSWNLIDPQIEANANINFFLALYGNPHVTSVHEWLCIAVEFKHEWQLTTLIQLNSEYKSTLLLSNLPRFFGMLSNQLSIGVSFRL